MLYNILFITYRAEGSVLKDWLRLLLLLCNQTSLQLSVRYSGLILILLCVVMFFNRTSDKLQLSEELVGSGQCCPLCQVMSCHVTIMWYCIRLRVGECLMKNCFVMFRPLEWIKIYAMVSFAFFYFSSLWAFLSLSAYIIVFHFLRL